MADLLAWPLLLLRADGRLLHANQAGQRLLARGEPLRLSGAGAVTVASERGAWAEALAAAAAGRRLLLSTGGAAMVLAPLAAGGPLLLALAPACGSREADVRGFAQAHQLSAAEGRVLLRLALGDSPADTAQVLGITAATVRSQLVAIRRKTGHASIADLAAAAASAAAGPSADAARAACRAC
ncbi:HTH luxR-type domain-containing protein [Rubrivivax sp. A210]|uniref:helix-turn-helix transcriptional regulator n=1 Tax=Rubrivivax sp. A210 TaxID=2772301 RepID=UPI00191B71A8|nr:helix-turn-helix transcriptional regulator [Rubrivivax sp. A210]CAD5373231.1 HTH luxR-type domain-containing protein [Rubrivivax sp. A210]